MNEIKIDIWSDVVCPFCFLGKAKLESVINKLNMHDQVTVEWHSFQLDPGFPKGTSAPSTEHLVKRKGIPLIQIQASQQRLADQGKSYGLDFQFEQAVNFNTLDVHRLLHWSKAFQKSNELKSAFLKAHFTDGVDLSKTENILNTVTLVGLDSKAALAVLQSNAYEQEVKQDIALANQIGISGVPFFVFNQKTAISGAQPDHVFEEVLTSMIHSL